MCLKSSRSERGFGSSEFVRSATFESSQSCMELSPSGRPYLRWKAYSNDDSSWTSSLGSDWRSMSPRSSPARMCSSGSSDLFVHKGVPDHIRSDSRESSRPKSGRECSMRLLGLLFFRTSPSVLAHRFCQSLHLTWLGK